MLDQRLETTTEQHCHHITCLHDHLKAKIVSLTEATEAIVAMFEKKIDEKDREILALKRRSAASQLKTVTGQDDDLLELA